MMAHNQAVLAVQDLGISYQVGSGWQPAVRDFHLKLYDGQIYGLVGESGSGKTTVINGIMRYLADNGRLEPESEILFMGEDLSRKSRVQMRPFWAERLKMVPQNPSAALNPSMKVGYQVAEVLRHHHKLNTKAARAAALDMFRKVQLVDPESVAQRYPHELSGGMQQRIVIAMALITNPQLLILDEPTTGLDVTTEAVILDLIRDLIQNDETQAAALYVTHNLGVVAQLCERVTVMYAGEIMEDGAVRDLYQQPLHPYTLGLLNSIPTIGQTKRESSLLSIEGNPPSLADLPQGCVFAPRCPFVIEKCWTHKPALESPAEGRSVRCHRWEEIANGTLQAQIETDNGLGQMERLDRDPLLQVDNLSKHFPVPRSILDIIQGRQPEPIRAVDGVNLGVQKGRTLGLVGESGSGKTTLSRVIVGLLERSSGTIDLLGMDIRNNVRQRSPDVLAALQMVFQNPQESLNPYLSVGQAIRRPLMKLNGLSRNEADRRAKELLEAVNLRAEYIDRYPAELSGGEKQRVVIARAFASNPDLVICDEPVSALDVSVQAAVLNLLARLQAENDTGYLFISHDLAVVGYLADYIAVMYLGQLVEVGYARDMFEPPYHPYTEALISAIPVADPDYHVERVLLSGDVPSARHLPTGCRFHTRCPRKLGAICETEVPPWRDDGDGHHIKCHISLEDLNAIQPSLLPAERRKGQ